MVSPTLGILILLYAFSINHVLAAGPFGMTWSDQQFGPDGPWQAVNVSIGSKDQVIALYPGASGASSILLNTICDDKTISAYCFGDEPKGGGLFASNESSTYVNYSTVDLNSFGDTAAVPITADATQALDTINPGDTDVLSVDLVTISSGYQTYPGGKLYPLQMGTLSLGSNDINVSLSGNGENTTTGTFITSYLYEQGSIPSYAYGMHIGSAALGIKGSLQLGGYDQSRVIGNVSSQSTSSSKLSIQLNDISIGVATGGSPWNSSAITGLLAQGNSSLSNGLQVDVDATEPYLYLPDSACKAIAAELPVTYDTDLGLYLWNTNASLYQEIVTSPSYLAFTFAKDSVDTSDLVIKIPFALLSLTLEAPLTTSSTSYFPCMGTDSTPELGRAFLQAAFVGVNWNQAKWFLAQAPGPDASSTETIVSIQDSDTTISGTDTDWEETWSTFWKPISTGHSSSGLSTGAKAGIGIGCAVAGLFVIAAAVWIFRRSRKNPIAVSLKRPTRSSTVRSSRGVKQALKDIPLI